MPLSGLAWRAGATLAAPALRLLLRQRLARGKEIAGRLDERRGVDDTPRPSGKLLWLHAASIGETASVMPVVAALPPEIEVLITTGTVSSAALLQRRLPELGLTARVRHRFVPLDVPGWVARFLNHWRPDAAAFVESELWPNLIRAVRARGIPLALLNARLSPRSAARWCRLPGLAHDLLGAFDLVQAQSEPDAARLAALGARGVTAPGNLKFAAPPLPVDAAELLRLRQRIGERPLWVAASTHPGEESLVLAAHAALAPRHPGLLTIIAPRHPERGIEIAREAPQPLPRRGAGEDPPPGGVWVADTFGELGLLYRLAGIVFVGKSLAGGGGQNPLEPARLGCAIAVGPQVGNFADAVAVLRAAGALTIVDGAAALAGWVDQMLRDPARRAAAGAAGAAAAARHAELPAHTAALLARLVASGGG